MKTAIVLGFYNKLNLGDDLFQKILKSWFENTALNYKFIFLNPMDISRLPDSDVILIGGGDLVNDYFFKKIRALVANYEGPIYSISLGFPYPQLISAEYLSMFDFIQTRTQSALPKIEPLFPDRCLYGPDIVRSLPITKSLNACKNKIVGVFFANPMWKNNANMLTKLTQLVKGIADIGGPAWLGLKTYTVHLYAMNTSGTQEDDTHLNKAIWNSLKSYSNIRIFNNQVQPEEFGELYMSVCTRFHAHILSMNAGVPFISLYSTEKVRDLLASENLMDYSVKMQVDPATLAPLDFSVSEALSKFSDVVHNWDTISTRLSIPADLTPVQEKLTNLLFYLPQKVRHGEGQVFNALKKVSKYLRVSMDQLEKIKITAANVSHITHVVTFALTRWDSAPFSWGLSQNLLAGHKLVDSIEWLVTNNPMEWNASMLNSKVPIPQRKYNFNYFSQDSTKGLHRMGWSYIVDQLKMYHNPKGIIFDNYLDKTFGWNLEFNKKIGVLPFKKPWTGVFHHTPDEMYDKNNLTVCIKSPEFIASLEYCESIIVLSSYLKNWLKRNLRYRVKIRVLYHPMEELTTTWTPQKWADNTDKKLVSIGAWLRNTHAIFALPNPKNMRKCALKGKNMDNYFPGDDFLAQIMKLPEEEREETTQICRHTTNKFLLALFDNIQKQLDSVEILSTLSNDEYDKILSENVVFLNLVDASAANTVLECIRCNTPLLINPLDAVIEYLGEDYPLYYRSPEEAMELINDETKILAAHEYLKAKDKSFIDISAFLQGVHDTNKRKIQ